MIDKNISYLHIEKDAFSASAEFCNFPRKQLQTYSQLYF